MRLRISAFLILFGHAAAASHMVPPEALKLLRPLVGPTLTDANLTSHNFVPGPWGADLGIPLVIPRSTSNLSNADVLHVFGDVECLCQDFPRTPNAQCILPSDAPALHNNITLLPIAGAPETCHTHPKSNFPYPVHKLETLPNGSTVPGGMILLPAFPPAVPASAAAARTKDETADNIATATSPLTLLLAERQVALFMMNVSTWGNHSDGFIEANGFVVKKRIPPTTTGDKNQKMYLQDSTGENSVAWQTETNGVLVNSAPIFAMGEGSDDDCNHVAMSSQCANRTIYIYFSKTFRFSPIYLARVPNFEALFDLTQYEYLSQRPTGAGRESQTTFSTLSKKKENTRVTSGAQWSVSASMAVPVVPESAGVGELSIAYLRCYKNYVLSYFSYKDHQRGGNEWKLRRSSRPEGPFSGDNSSGGNSTTPTTLILMNSTTTLPWEYNGWGGPYGGYIYQTPSLLLTTKVRLVLSLWKPYAASDVELDLEPYWGPCI